MSGGIGGSPCLRNLLNGSPVRTCPQALTLFKKARRDSAVNLRTFNLANLPCNTLPLTAYYFVVDNDNTPVDDTARERTIGLNNRVIAGMLVHTHRAEEKTCPSSKFDVIQNICTGKHLLLIV